jgi:hypothetical protein
MRDLSHTFGTRLAMPARTFREITGFCWRDDNRLGGQVCRANVPQFRCNYGYREQSMRNRHMSFF